MRKRIEKKIRMIQKSQYKLNDHSIREYREKGYLETPNVFTNDEISLLKRELRNVLKRKSNRIVKEKGSNSIRSHYGAHMINRIFKDLTRNERILDPIRQILKSEAYVYQFKINTKASFDGDLWDWHQDYIFWNREDGLRSDNVINLAILLDPMHEFNGPCFFMPGSQKEGMIDLSSRTKPDPAYKDSPKWILNLTSNLKYSLDRNSVKTLIKKYGIVSVKASEGSVVFFDGNMVHASPSNISPFDRTIIIITYSSVKNKPKLPKNPRPDFLVSRDYRPLKIIKGSIRQTVK